MNNFKFIARYAATAALIAGVSSQAAAQILCSGTPDQVQVQCPTPPQGFTSTLKSTPPTGATTGQSQVPFNGQDPYDLSVGKFDKASVALSEGVDESWITLVGVELQLELEATEIYVQADSTYDLGECDFTWDVGLDATLTAVAGQGLDALQVATGISVSQGGTLPINDGVGSPPDYEWRLSTDGGGSIIDTQCFAEVSDLANWEGAGTINFELNSSAFYFFDTNGCGNNLNGTSNEGIGTVTVVYYYCVLAERGGGNPVPCACDTPSPNYRRPGSLLLFPEFDNREGDVTVVTVTNTDCDGSAGGTNVDVEFIYIDANGCGEFNKTETLTPCDTLTLLTNFHNPNQEQGYMYAFAKNDANDSIVWNHLIGSLLVVSGIEAFDYGINPVVFRGIGNANGVVQPNGRPTDLDGDGNRDLDGKEYDTAPNTITIPRFLGQDAPGNNSSIRSQVILVALSGGVRFETNVCFLFWNDNEEVFSGEYNFSCWDKPFLDDMSMGFRNDFLQTTNHDPLEIGGAPQRESGWICIQGCRASSTQETIDDPAIYAVLVERVGSWGVADLPFECGNRVNGSLLPTHIFGDGDPTPVNGDDQ